MGASQLPEADFRFARRITRFSKIENIIPASGRSGLSPGGILRVERHFTNRIGEYAGGSSAVNFLERRAGSRAPCPGKDRLKTCHPGTLYGIVARLASLEVFCAPDAGNGSKEFSGGAWRGQSPPTSRADAIQQAEAGRSLPGLSLRPARSEAERLCIINQEPDNSQERRAELRPQAPLRDGARL